MRIILFGLFVFIASFAQAQKTDKKLQKKIEELMEGFNGQVGIYVKDLEKGRVAMINPDTVFPTASIVKIPILVGVMDKIEKGELVYHEPMIYKDSLYYAGTDILGSFKAGEKIELARLMMLMMTM